jgi:hypothetical protein
MALHAKGMQVSSEQISVVGYEDLPRVAIFSSRPGPQVVCRKQSVASWPAPGLPKQKKVEYQRQSHPPRHHLAKEPRKYLDRWQKSSMTSSG